MNQKTEVRGEKSKFLHIDAEGLHYKVLNKKIHQAVGKGYGKIILDNVCGQRYIGDGLEGKDLEIVINGVPGNDLSAFMNGPRIIVKGNAQDGVGNTMNAGQVIIHGDAGDILGYSMRGGKIFVKGDIGYRVGIHMKAYNSLFPVVIVGGTARDFLGEYMAGGILVVLGLNESCRIVGDFVGTGMHGGSIFIGGQVDERCLGKEVKITSPNDKDRVSLKKYLGEYCTYFGFNLNKILKRPFIKLYTYTHSPYGKLYAY